MTQHEKLMGFFKSGKEITPAQAAGLFQVTNPMDFGLIMLEYLTMMQQKPTKFAR